LTVALAGVNGKCLHPKLRRRSSKKTKFLKGANSCSVVPRVGISLVVAKVLLRVTWSLLLAFVLSSALIFVTLPLVAHLVIAWHWTLKGVAIHGDVMRKGNWVMEILFSVIG
jgi:hypothetical protein